MKKSLILCFCLMAMMPAFANSVKQNNYSEELNTETVNDFVSKKVIVTTNEENKTTGETTQTVQKFDTPTQALNYSATQNYISIKENSIAQLKAKQNAIAEYFDIKIKEIQAMADNVRATTKAKTDEQMNTVLSVYNKQIKDLEEKKKFAMDQVQGDIDILQVEIDSLKARQEQK